MALTYLELSELAKNPKMQARVQFALHITVTNILRNPGGQTAPTLAWAKREARGPSPNLLPTMLRVITDAAVVAAGAAVADSALQAAVDAAVADLVAMSNAQGGP